MVLLTGSTGMLGVYVRQTLMVEGIEIAEYGRGQFNLDYPDELKRLPPGTDLVMHLAAETDVDLCERRPNVAWTKNYLSVMVLADLCRSAMVPLVFVSTSNVFGAEGRASYNELDSPSPVNYYGKSKMLAEAYIRKTVDSHVIIRSGWMIGGGPERDKKFVGKIIKQIRDGAREISAVSDRYGSVTYARDLATLIWSLVSRKKYGTYHFASFTSCTRFDIAKRIVESFDSNVAVSPFASSEFPLSAPRPVFEVIQTVALPGDLKGLLFTWQETLDQYLLEWKGL